MVEEEEGGIVYNIHVFPVPLKVPTLWGSFEIKNVRLAKIMLRQLSGWVGSVQRCNVVQCGMPSVYLCVTSTRELLLNHRHNDEVFGANYVHFSLSCSRTPEPYRHLFSFSG